MTAASMAGELVITLREIPGRPRTPEAVEKDRARMRGIVDELGRLDTDVGSQPVHLPPNVG